MTNKLTSKYNNFLLLCSCISLLSCFIVLFAIASDPLGAKSVNTKLIFRLLFCDLMICVIYIIYYCVDHSLKNYDSNDDVNERTMEIFCKYYLAFPMFFFIASWGWTALIAYRFSIKPSISREKTIKIKKLPIPMHFIWIISLIIILPTLLSVIFTKHGVSNVEISSRSRQCIYNYGTALGQSLNILTLLIPMSLTLLYNIYCYGNGLLALQTAPQSVISRQMRRAGGYVFIFIGVWAPNFTYSILRIIGNTSTSDFYHTLLNASLTLTILQVIYYFVLFYILNIIFLPLRRYNKLII